MIAPIIFQLGTIYPVCVFVYSRQYNKIPTSIETIEHHRQVLYSLTSHFDPQPARCCFLYATAVFADYFSNLAFAANILTV